MTAWPDVTMQCSEAERVVLGCVLDDPSLLSDLAHLRAEHFHAPRWSDAWSLLQAKHDAGQPIDLVTLPRELVAAGWDRIDVADLLELPHRYAPAVNLALYVSTIIDRWRDRERRRLLESALQNLEAAQDAKYRAAMRELWRREAEWTAD